MNERLQKKERGRSEKQRRQSKGAQFSSGSCAVKKSGNPIPCGLAYGKRVGKYDVALFERSVTLIGVVIRKPGLDFGIGRIKQSEPGKAVACLGDLPDRILGNKRKVGGEYRDALVVGRSFHTDVERLEKVLGRRRGGVADARNMGIGIPAIDDLVEMSAGNENGRYAVSNRRSSQPLASFFNIRTKPGAFNEPASSENYRTHVRLKRGGNKKLRKFLYLLSDIRQYKLQLA